MAATGAVPPALRDRPKLHDRNRHILEAFFWLDAGRSFGEAGALPITGEDMRGHLTELGFTDPDERLYLLDLLRALDSVARTAYVEKHKALAPK